MARESDIASVKAEQREIEAFLDDPASHQQIKHAWRPTFKEDDSPRRYEMMELLCRGK